MPTVSAVRAQLELSRQYEALSADLRCLAEALETQPPVAPPGPPPAVLPFDDVGPSDCRFPAATEWVPHSRAGLTADEVAAAEERTFQLLAALDREPPNATGPLSMDLLAAATPPP